MLLLVFEYWELCESILYIIASYYNHTMRSIIIQSHINSVFIMIKKEYFVHIFIMFCLCTNYT